jgi:hypothetical protein
MTDQSNLVNVNDLEWQPDTIGGHNYKGLLYDARMGVTVSQIMLYQAFVAMVKRQQKPPLDMLSFIAKEMDLVLTGKQQPKAMFNKKGAKGATSSPHYWQMVEMCRTGIEGDIKAVFEHVSELLGGKPSTSQIEKHYYRENSRLKRIKLVGDLLTEYESILDIPRGERTIEHRVRMQKIDEQLADIYKNSASLA